MDLGLGYRGRPRRGACGASLRRGGGKVCLLALTRSSHCIITRRRCSTHLHAGSGRAQIIGRGPQRSEAKYRRREGIFLRKGREHFHGQLLMRDGRTAVLYSAPQLVTADCVQSNFPVTGVKPIFTPRRMLPRAPLVSVAQFGLGFRKAVACVHVYHRCARFDTLIAIVVTG